MSAIEAVSVKANTMADDTLRLTIDIPPMYANQAFEMFGKRGVPIAIVRLTQEAATQSAQQETIEADKPKGGFLSQWLALRCKEQGFWDFVEAKGYAPVNSEQDCNDAVKLFLGIESKAELDNDKEAEARFHSMIRLPYAEWLMGRR
jgi:hypothetical protein